MGRFPGDPQQNKLQNTPEHRLPYPNTTRALISCKENIAIDTHYATSLLVVTLQDGLENLKKLRRAIGMDPMSGFWHSVEVAILHLGVVLAVPSVMFLIIVVTLPPVDVLHGLPPLLVVTLSEGVAANVVIALKGQQRHIHRPSVPLSLLDEISLQQGTNVFRKGYFVDPRVDGRQRLSEVNPAECFEHISGVLVGGVVADGIGGDINEDHAVHKRLDLGSVVSFGEFHQCQCTH